jgi:streptogramin lyase
MVWNDTQIIIGLRDLNWFPTWVKVKTPAGASAQLPTNNYTYAVYPTSPPLPSQPPPLAIAIDPAGRVFVNEEFHSDLKAWSPQTGAVAPLHYPASSPPGIFSQDFYGESRTTTSILGEDVRVDPSGTVWFSEGGNNHYAGAYPNHSRIVAYDPPTAAFRVYNVPGNGAEVYGLAWDPGRRRVWFTTAPRLYDCLPWWGCAVALPARLVSFDPTRIPPDNAFTFSTAGLTCDGGSPTTVGTCSNVPSRPCLTASDCVLAEQVCPSGVTDDSACYHEYPIPDMRAAHLVVDAAGAVWFTAYAGGNYLGRLEPATGAVTQFPLPPPVQASPFASAPWQIALAADGDIVFTEFSDGEVGRFDVAQLGNPACLALDASHRNPCIKTFLAPGGAPGTQTVHSMALDAGGRTWFAQAARESSPAPTTSLGYVTADWSGIVMLPPLALYPCALDGRDCGVAPGTQPPFDGAGMAIDPSTGDVWVAEFSRRRLGRLHRVS